MALKAKAETAKNAAKSGSSEDLSGVEMMLEETAEQIQMASLRQSQ